MELMLESGFQERESSHHRSGGGIRPCRGMSLDKGAPLIKSIESHLMECRKYLVLREIAGHIILYRSDSVSLKLVFQYDLKGLCLEVCSSLLAISVQTLRDKCLHSESYTRNRDSTGHDLGSKLLELASYLKSSYRSFWCDHFISLFINYNARIAGIYFLRIYTSESFRRDQYWVNLLFI